MSGLQMSGRGSFFSKAKRLKNIEYRFQNIEC